jgi:hypothetical protein
MNPIFNDVAVIAFWTFLTYEVVKTSVYLFLVLSTPRQKPCKPILEEPCGVCGCRDKMVLLDGCFEGKLVHCVCCYMKAHQYKLEDM